MIFKLFLKSLSVFPLGIQYRLADFFCLLLRLFPNRAKSLIRRNIQLCFPELGSKEKKSLCRATLSQSCYLTFEMAATWCWPADKILSHIAHLDVCDEFYNSRKSRIVLVPHLGNWELLILWLARFDNFICLYKPQPDPAVDRFIFDARSRNGATMLPVDSSGLRQLSRGLKKGKTAMILPDQRPKKHRTRIDARFFGVDAPTSPLIHNLCSRIDCDVFLAAILRDTEKLNYSLTMEALDHAQLAGDQQHSVEYMNAAIESLVNQHPDQYQWAYSRFQRYRVRSPK